MQLQAIENNQISNDAEYIKIVNKVALMSKSSEMKGLTKKLGLDVVDVAWEDTGRGKNSTLGPNISDVTIQVQVKNDKKKIEPIAMPIIRYPNYQDKTVDLLRNDFYLLVGNEKGKTLKKVTLVEYLDNFRKYLTDSQSWSGIGESLYDPRDTYVLVSAQMAFLPVPRGKKAFFNPVIFNYQSYEKNPAVLVIVATREGTSATIVDNTRNAFDDERLGQRLFFNQNGKRASFTAERKLDFLKKPKHLETNTLGIQASNESGMNMVLIIQVPLVHREIGKDPIIVPFDGSLNFGTFGEKGGVEDAVVGHGETEGKFVEIDNLEIERDERFPIRITVQFYKATTDTTFSKKELIAMKKQLDGIYENSNYVGSLVIQGKTSRPTEHNVSPSYPVWWTPFWKKYSLKTGMTEENAVKQLKVKYGKEWRRMFRTQGRLLKVLKLILKNKK